RNRNRASTDQLSPSMCCLGAVIDTSEHDLEIEPQGAVSQFVAENAASDLIVRTHWATEPHRHEGTPVFDSGAVWSLHRAGEDFLFQFTSPSMGPVPYNTAHVNTTFTSNILTLSRTYFAGPPPRYR